MRRLLKTDNLYIYFSLILGAIVFVLIYGIAILNPFYTNWTLREGTDFSQHYLGRLFFKNSPWTFPFGMFNSLSYPNSASVFFLDTVPLATVIFKVFTTVFNVTKDCQFFGIYGLICFMLHGVFGYLISKKFINRKPIALFCSLLFIIVPPMIDKMFWQTAVASHWLILFAICLCVYNDDLKNNKIKLISLWGMLGFLSGGIHSYIVAYNGLVNLFLCFYNFLNSNIKNVFKRFFYSFASFVSFCISAIFSFWIFGVFNTKIEAIGWGFGTYNANLNSLFNPYHTSVILNRLSDIKDSYNYGYLGFGVIILSVVAIFCFFFNLKKAKEEIIRHRQILIFFFILLFISIILSAIPVIAFNQIIICKIKLPIFLENIMQMFRANDRFIFMANYMIITAIVWLLSKSVSNRKIAIMVFFAICLQIYDLSGYLIKKHNLYNTRYKYSSVLLNNKELNELAKGKKYIYSDKIHNYNELYELAYWANKKKMVLSSFYFSRSVQKQSDVTDDKEFVNNAIFVFKTFPQNNNLSTCRKIQNFNNIVFCTANFKDL